MPDMLQCESTIDALWRRLGCRVVLPEPLEEFLLPKGPMPMEFIDKRRYRRFHYRQRAILTRQGKHAAVYTRNISRGGLCFVHFEQLYPLEEVSLALSCGSRVDLIVRRCRRQNDQCYECGAEIQAVSQEMDREIRSLIGALACEVADPLFTSREGARKLR